MKRRDLFRFTLAAGVAAAISLPSIASAENVPIIYGDGIHDDTDGLQAAVDGKDFICDGGYVKIVDGKFLLEGGHYRISRTVHLTGDTDRMFKNAAFETTGTGPAFFITSNKPQNTSSAYRLAADA